MDCLIMIEIKNDADVSTATLDNSLEETLKHTIDTHEGPALWALLRLCEKNKTGSALMAERAA